MTLPRRAVVAFVADAACVVAFAAVGRRSHDDSGNAVAGALTVAAPFLIGLAIAWGIFRAHASPLLWRTGVALWLTTVAAGMMLRRVVFDRGTALSFVIVATIALGVLLNGWRTAARRAVRGTTPR